MNRRKFLQEASATAALATLPYHVVAQEGREKMATRRIPSTGELLPIVGFGNSGSFRANDYENTEKLLDTLREFGGKFIDTGGNTQRPIGRYMKQFAAHDDVFLGTNISANNAEADLQAIATAKQIQGKDTLDLLQLQRPADFHAQWPRMQRWRDEGHARYIGIAATGNRFFDLFESLLREGSADFIQINYSMMEAESGEKLLPLARDKGVAVVTNRPFLNGQYFSRVAELNLPEWAADFDCNSWAQFSLKWILANPIVNCTLTETTKVQHAVDNLSAGLGRLPDAAERARMQAFMRSI